MNSENRYPVTASIFMLKEIKRRQEYVMRGYQLLKRKAEVLKSKGRQTAIDLTGVQTCMGNTLRDAYMTLAAIKFTNGESNALVLENIGEAQIRVQRINENISGVNTFSLHALEDPGVNDSFLYAGLGAGGHRTTEAKHVFRQAIIMLIQFASLRNTCLLLDAAFKSAMRKLKGIEKVILPKLKNTENYIVMEIDEREREDFHRVKMMKAKKLRKKTLASMRTMENSKHVKSGDNIGEGNLSYSHIRSLECLTSMYPCAERKTSEIKEFGDINTSYCFWDEDVDVLF